MDMGRNENLGQKGAAAFRAYVQRRSRLRSSLVWLREGWYRAQYLYLILGTRKERSVAQEAMPILRRFSRGSCSIEKEMRAVFREYTSTISLEGMPISFESACLLWSLCEATNPKRILDMGSGFSSFVFRRYQSTAGTKPEVWSVDENKDWLEITRTFLASHKLLEDNLLYWGDFKAVAPGRFDLISFDLGIISERPSIFEEMLALLNPGGLIILDDMHKPEYRTEIDIRLKSHDAAAGYSVRWLTLDKHLRYCMLVRQSSRLD